MPWKFGPYWEADSLTERMNSAGWLEDQQAAHVLEVPIRRIEALGACGTLRTEQIHGRRWVSLEDVTVMRAGLSPEDYRDREHARKYGCAMGWETSSTAERIPDPAPSDAGMDFLKNFG